MVCVECGHHAILWDMGRTNFFRGLLIVSVLVLLFQYSLLLNVTKPLSLLHGDAFLVNFILSHYMHIIDTGNWTQWPTLPMLYGFPRSLFFTEFYPLHALAVWPIWKLSANIFLASNILVVLTVLFSAIAMYAYAFVMVGGIAPSLLAAIIFSLNPFLFARYPDHALVLNVGCIPLILLGFELALRRKKGIWLFVMFLALTVQLLTSTLYYSVFLTVFLPLYVLLRLYQTKEGMKAVRSLWTAVGVGIFFTVTWWVSSLYAKTFTMYPLSRGLQAAQVYAAIPTDWLFTGPENILYGSLKARFAAAFPSYIREGISAEHNLFPGIVPIVLFIVSFFLVRRGKHRALWWLGIFCIAFGFFLSLGPAIAISPSRTIPGPYLLIRAIDPLFSALRVPARFGVFTFFGLALVGALTLKELLRPYRSITRLTISILLISLILIEYANKPLSTYTISDANNDVYKVIRSRQDIKVVIDLPIGNLVDYTYRQARSEEGDARYLLYALLYHHKILFNGYTGFLPAEYYRRANMLSVNFPTIAKLSDLREWGVDAIILHREEFPFIDDFGRLRSDLIAKGVPQIATTEDLVLFDLTKWPETRR